jgi:hypothetical protein
VRRLRGWAPAATGGEGEGEGQVADWADSVRGKMVEGNIACVVVLEEDVNSAWLMCAIIPQATKEAEEGEGEGEGEGDGAEGVEGLKKIKPTHTKVVRSQIDRDALAALRAGDTLVLRRFAHATRNRNADCD